MMPIFEEISIQRIHEKYEINNNKFLTFQNMLKSFWDSDGNLFSERFKVIFETPLCTSV